MPESLACGVCLSEFYMVGVSGTPGPARRLGRTSACRTVFRPVGPKGRHWGHFCVQTSVVLIWRVMGAQLEIQDGER